MGLDIFYPKTLCDKILALKRVMTNTFNKTGGADADSAFSAGYYEGYIDALGAMALSCGLVALLQACERMGVDHEERLIVRKT